MKLMGEKQKNAKKEEKDKPAEEDHMSKLMKLFGGGKEEKEKDAEDDTLSKIKSLLNSKEPAAADEGKMTELKRQHEEEQLKTQKRIVELMEKASESQKAADEAKREARL